MIKKIAFLLCLFSGFAFFNAHAQTCTNTFVISFQPTTGPANTVVTINGTGFQYGSGVTAVYFDGIPSEFTIVSDTKITAMVPEDATTGSVTLSGDGGCMTASAGNFTPITSSCNSEIYISEIYDAQAQSPGAIELYNPGSSSINFNGQYVLERYGTYSDAAPTNGYSLILTGSIAPFSTYLVRSGPAPCNLTINPVMGSGINAQDAIKLRKNGAIIDAVHAPNEVGYSIIRKPNAIAPAATYNAADWNTFSQESCSNLGIHTATAPPVTVPDVLNPDPVVICLGDDAVFSTGVSGSGYTYQWKTLNISGNWVNANNGGIYSGATTDTFIISGPPAALDGSQYYCQITSATCTLVSYAAMLTLITVPDPTATATQPDCVTPTGTITVTAPLGPEYSYTIDNGITWQISPLFEDLDAGSYTIFVKHNDTGCISTGITKVINDPVNSDAPEFDLEQPACDTPTGTITVTSPTGAGYTYSIGNGYQSSPVFDELDPGLYSVTLKDANGCTSEAADAIIEPVPDGPASAATSVEHPDCENANGTITITAPVGTGFMYSIDGGDTWQPETAFEVPAGTYTITTQNAAGCTSLSNPVTVNPQPAAPTAAATSVEHPDCNNPDGTITITAPVGAGFMYSIDGGDTWQPETAFEVPAGTYAITTQNAAGCTSVTGNIVVNPQPAAPDAAATSVEHPDCENANGTITITAPVGTGFMYSIDGGNTWHPEMTFEVPAGTYTITTQNAAGCTSITGNIVVNPQPAAPDAAATSVEHPDCNNPNGTITVITPVGAGYMYSINEGDTWQPETAFEVPAGTYTITTQNAAGCTSVTGNIIVNPQPATPAAPTVNYAPPTCTTAASITVTAPTGAGFTYSKDGVTYGPSATFTVTEGTYSITVKNAAGCTSPATVQAAGPAPAVPVAPIATVQHPGCNDTTGSITITSPPAGPGITYSVNGINYVATATFTLAPGSYPVTVMNADGCVSPATIKVINPVPATPAAPNLTAQHPLCGQTTGSITVTSPTGTGLMYSKNGGTTWQPGTIFGSLPSGTYSIIVKNAAGCISAASTQTVNPPPAAVPLPVLAPVQPDCNVAFGTISVTSPTGAGYTYSINNGTYQTSPVFTPLTQGTYTITVKNAGGCTASAQQVINAAPAHPPVPTVFVQQPDCDTALGKITVMAPVGGGHTYSLDGVTFQPSPVFLNVNPGAYTLTVRNNPGCTSTLAITINPQPAPAPSPGTITGNNAVCIDDTLQLANTATGGIWASSNASIATVDATGLVTPVHPGTVTITYTVGTVCTASAQKTILVTPLPQLHPPTQIYLCEDMDTGEFNPAIIDSGLPQNGFTFAWEKDGEALPDTANAITINEPGTYTVTATNTASNCSNSASTTVGTSSLAVAYAEVGQDFHSNQAITVYVTGGSGDYEYSLDGGPYQDDPYFNGITDGLYTVTIRDKNGCGVAELEVFALNYPHYFTPNGDGTKDVWNIKGLTGQYDARIFIYDRYGKLISAFRPGGGGWDGTYNGHDLPATDYWFTVSYRASNGQDKEFKAHFSLIR